ncbi:MAG: hypothetical protein DCF27_00465 [Lysobacteraceae bacterium]|nr:MAG: hypothetical protein DCF27_00465 [Xanthomonadaceae bacterium]
MRKSHFLIAPIALALAFALGTDPALATVGDIASAGDSQVAVPARFSRDGGQQVAAWSLLGDPALAALVERAMAANTDLRQALARLEMARAGSRAATADSLPQGAVSAGRQSGEPTLSPWAGSVGLSWELDLFGRQTRQRKAARARADGAGATIEAVRLAVAAEVARTWFQLQGARERADLRDGSVAAQLRIVALTRDLVELGSAAPADLARSLAEFATDQAELAQARDTVFALEARLAVLLGETPGAWRAPPSREMSPLVLQALALPEPDALLRARPDVRAAERALAARAADAHAAGAARFPRLTLSGLLGFVAGDLGGLFSSTPDSRAQGAELSWGLFSLPRLQADYRGAQAGSRLALAEYDQVVLEAVEETEVALQRHGSSIGQVRLRLEAARQARVAAEAAQARYEEGAAPSLDALVARRDAVGTQVAAIEALVHQRIAVVDVLRALGTAPVAAPAVADP